MILRITKGPREGDKIEVKPGMKLGRSAADINLKDSKASSLHAEIRLAPGGQSLVLVDLGSTNGIRVSGNKVQEVPLLAGAEFGIGATRFVVESPESPPPSPQQSVEEWRDSIQRIASQAALSPRPKQHTLSGFKQIVELTFLEGVQKGECYIAGYGPRYVGSKSFDLPIYEAGAPSVCFALVPDQQGQAIFKTDHQNTVLLNEKAVSSEKLADGDVISILGSRLRVALKSNQDF
jgi:hypothetical protein